MRLHPLAAITLAIVLVACGPARARAAAPDDEACTVCHSNPDLVRESDAKSSVHVDVAGLKASAHASLGCTSCHRDATAPHPAKLQKVACGSCHADAGRELRGGAHAALATRGAQACVACHGTHEVRPAARMGRDACASCHANVVEQYRGSVHGLALAGGDPEASTCRDCHGSAHALRSHRDSTSTVSHERLAATCARCHSDRALMERRKITIPTAVELYRNSVHGRSKNPHAATCSDCHESHALKRATDPTSSINRMNIPATCGRCHEQAARDYDASIHGSALARGVTRSPTCTDCHGEHRIRGPRDPDSPVSASGVTATCSRCHEATGIRETYGLPAGRLSSYEDSFHGLAARGGSPVVAECASCHGHHLILPSSDPRSRIAPANLPATCGQCHPGAGERFASGKVHVVMARADEPVLLWVRKLYLWLIALTIGGMAVHQGLHFARQSAKRFREQQRESADHVHTPSGRMFERMTVLERVQHGLLAVSFFTLVYTGFALKYPESTWFAWLARLEQGYAWRAGIHRWAAGVMVAVAVLHVIYLFSARGRALLRDLLPRLADARDAGLNLLYLVGLRSSPPRFDRFGYVEKAEYWALVWGTVVMTLTGLMLWFERETLHWVDKWVLDLATIVHYYEAWLAFLAIVVWHLYQNIANPEVYPMNWTWLTGRISEEALRHEHPLEWERAVSEEIPSGDAPGPGGAPAPGGAGGPGGPDVAKPRS